MNSTTCRAILLFLALSVWTDATTRAAPSLTVIGGPTYNFTTSSGYSSPVLPTPAGGSVNNSGVAAGYATKYQINSLGTRAFRWGSGIPTPIELGTLTQNSIGAAEITTTAINNNGDIVGIGRPYQGNNLQFYRAVRWSAGSSVPLVMQNLSISSTGDAFTLVKDINDSGISVGFSFDYATGGGNRPVRWDAAGNISVMGNLGTDTSGGISSIDVLAINNAGFAAGYLSKYTTTHSLRGTRAVRWSPAGVATELANLGTTSGGSTEVTANGINASGTVIGQADKYVSGVSKGRRAVRWNGGGTAITELGNLGTDANGNLDSYVLDINDLGTSVGYTDKFIGTAYKGFRPVKWNSGTTAAVELGILGTDVNGIADGKALAINSGGFSVGYMFEYVGGDKIGQRAVLWGTDNVAIDLNTLIDHSTGWVNLYEARDISDTGWITGYGLYDDGVSAYNRMFLLQVPSAVPEPAMFGLVAFCTIAFSIHRLRQRQGR